MKKFYQFLFVGFPIEELCTPELAQLKDVMDTSSDDLKLLFIIEGKGIKASELKEYLAENVIKVPVCLGILNASFRRRMASRNFPA